MRHNSGGGRFSPFIDEACHKFNFVLGVGIGRAPMWPKAKSTKQTHHTWNSDQNAWLPLQKKTTWPQLRQLKKRSVRKGHFTHKTEGPLPLHFKHSHWWKRRGQSKFASHYAWGTNGVCECKMDVKSTWIPTWHPMDRVSWSLGLFLKTISWR